MLVEEVMNLLANAGQDSIKKTLLRHGVCEPLFGVKIEELKKIQKLTKQNTPLALELYRTHNHDAMYLAGLIAEPAHLTESDLQEWAENAKSPMIREYTVAWVAAESQFAEKLALEWINSPSSDLHTIGWATISSFISITPDSALNLDTLRSLVKQVINTIAMAPDREKLAMNDFVISCGTYVSALGEEAKKAAMQIGKISANMGDTACKIPDALEKIVKAENKGIVGKKRKSARC